MNTDTQTSQLLDVKKLPTTRTSRIPQCSGNPEWLSPPRPQTHPKVLFWCPPPFPKASAPQEYLGQHTVAFCPYPFPPWPSDPCLHKSSFSPTKTSWEGFKLSSRPASISSTVKQTSPLAKSCVEPVPPLTSPHQVPCQIPISFYKKLPVWSQRTRRWLVSTKCV